MIRLMVAAPASGGGKTVLACALLAAFQKRGLHPCAFKCGPDYIDPMYHRAVPGVESRSLDLFLMGEDRMRDLYQHSIRGCGAAVCEAAMGYYDGLGGTTDAGSAWRTAETLQLPVLLTVQAKGAGLSLAALIQGMRQFRANSRITGVILNDCSPALCRTLSRTLEQETGMPVLGCLPHLRSAEIPSRHLGLYPAQELYNLRGRLQELAEALESNVDMERLLDLFGSSEPEPWELKPQELKSTDCPSAVPVGANRLSTIPIGVARDEAFCFAYTETLETLSALGAEPVFFSPLRDTALPPDIGGLYLPGGYPELYAYALFENRAMCNAVAAAVRDGLPTVAECGGFLYLGRDLQDADGTAWPMAGVLPGTGFPAGHLVRFGYGTLTADSDSLLFRAGEEIPVHEFHHWDSTEPGDALSMTKPLTGRSWRCGFVGETLYAAFPHLCFAGRPVLAERFVCAARQYAGIKNRDKEYAGIKDMPE